MNKQEFYQRYKADICPMLDDLEAIRIKKVRNLRNYILLSLIIPIFGFLIITNLQHIQNVTIAVLAIIMLILGIGMLISLIPFCMSYAKGYSRELKNKILSPLLKTFGDIELCSDKKILFEDELVSSGLFERDVNFLFDDKFCGCYKGVNFGILETTSPTRALVLAFQSDKTIRNRTVVVAKRTLFQNNSDILRFWIPIVILIAVITYASGCMDLIKILEYLLFILMFVLFGFVIYFYGKPFNKEPLNKINLEDVKFASTFDIYSSDEVEARYLVTSAFMERVLNLKAAFDYKKLKCAFYDDKLIIAMNTSKDLFEVGGLLKSTKDSTCVSAFYNELASILNMIEYFKLDEKTGL